MSTVTANAVHAVIGLQLVSIHPTFLPIFQVISIKAVGNENGGTIWWNLAILSNGTHFVQGMLATVQKEESQENN
jgi:hypothetical protein